MTTKPKQAHTPTPYKASKSKESPVPDFIMAETECIAHVHDLGFDRAREKHANASFIVRACNSHKDLLRQLKSMTGFINQMIDDEAIDLKCFPALEDDVRESEKAITKAEAK